QTQTFSKSRFKNTAIYFPAVTDFFTSGEVGLEQTAEVVGIPLIDHIVVGIDRAISIQEWRSGNRW
ncbi:MAG: hypothetical protein NTX48_06920, partial [Planctomycetales bacterium]|nr:hypothetical protein [Planctomycetales bacterium]